MPNLGRIGTKTTKVLDPQRFITLKQKARLMPGYKIASMKKTNYLWNASTIYN